MSDDLTDDEAKLLAAITEKEVDFPTVYRAIGLSEQMANTAFVGLASKGLADGDVLEHKSSRTGKVDRVLIKSIWKL